MARALPSLGASPGAPEPESGPASPAGLCLKVALVTPELQSLVQRTNLAAVAESLALALREAGCDVRVFLPCTRGLNLDALNNVRTLGNVRVPDGRTPDNQRPPSDFKVHEGELRGLPVYLFDHPALFASRFPYGDDEGPYADNWRRYALFSRACLESLALLEFEPDVIHGLDWTCGLLPLLHQLEYVEPGRDHPAAQAGSFFAIHNLAMQGSFERDILPRIGIPHAYFRNVRGVELGAKVNFLKAGAEFATVLGTLSPSHALKIQERDRGYGLEDVFQRRSKELVGIHNGIDYQAWDPATDPALPAPFARTDKELVGKRKCKSQLQSRLGLDNGPRTPLAACIGRWDADGGVDLLAEILTPVLERGLELVVMGSGTPEIQQRLKTMEATFIGRCRIIDGYHTATAHLIMGGADFMLLPSHYQPATPLAAIGMRYGVVPVVYAHSGLEDVVVDASTNAANGLGFHFDPYSGEGLLGGVDRALKAYKNPANWKALVRRCMAQNFSWAATAENYLKAYRRVTRRSRSRQEAGE
jgi:starch synthase